MRNLYGHIGGVKYDPNQPRVPAGQPGGGEWVGNNTAQESRRAEQYTTAKKFIYRNFMGPFGAGNSVTDAVMQGIIGGKRSRALRLAKYMAGMAQWRRNVDKFADKHPGVDLSELTVDDLIENDLRPPRPPEWARSAFGPLANTSVTAAQVFGSAPPNAKNGWDDMVNIVKQALRVNDDLTDDDMASIIATWMMDRYKIPNSTIPPKTPPKK